MEHETKRRTLQIKTSQRYGVNPNEVIRNDVMEFYIDNDGVI